MIAQGRAAFTLDQFDRSPKMEEILSMLKGQDETRIPFENLGTSREAIFAITLLRIKGYVVNLADFEIIVKEGE